MNLDEYRALKAQEQVQQNSPNEGEQADVQTQQGAADTDEPHVPQTTATEPTRAEDTAEKTAQPEPSTNQETELPKTITIEGVGEVPLEELQRGYLRQSDYTRKTQQLANEKREIEQALDFYKKVQENPSLSQQLADQYQIPNLDPNQARITELEQRYNDLLLQTEVEKLQNKYEDFDAREVLQLAYDKRIESLEDAYLLAKASKPKSQETTTQEPQTLDVDAIKEQLRQELRQELELERSTRTIIQPGGGTPPPTTDSPKLSEGELKVARAMRLSPEEYVKWRTKK